MKKIKVSIIVPVYNVEKYIEKCLDSLVNQTLNGIEIIVVNDGSPDNSQSIIDKYVEQYPKLIKSFIKENGGLGDARNYGVSKAKGEFIAFVDSDDFVNVDMYEKLYTQSVVDNSDVVVCGYNVLDEEYKFLNYQPSFDEKISQDEKIRIMLGDNAAWNKIYKRELITKNNLQFRSKIWYEDIDFKINTILHCKKISVINEGLYNYLIRQGSIMNNSNIEKNVDILLAFDKIIEYCKVAKKTKKYFSEIEFLAIQHILIAGITRIINSSGDKKSKKEVIYKLEKYLNAKFPNYQKNKYIKYLPINKKIIYNLLKNKLYILVKIIFKIKR